MRGRRQPEVIAGRVNADGTIAAGDGFTVTHTTGGQYTITFPTGFRLVSITASPVTGDQRWPTFFNLTERSAQAYVMDSGGVSLDRAFSFVAVGAP